MSQKGLEEVIGRAAVDRSFLIQLINGREEALAGYDLTREEKATLCKIDLARAEELCLDKRLTAKSEIYAPPRPRPEPRGCTFQS